MLERPTDAEIDVVITKLRREAHGAACQGASETPFTAAITCIEWASGRPKTEVVPFYLVSSIGA